MALLYACLLLIALISKKGIIVSIMRLRPLRYLGTIAYGVYIMHVAVLGLAYGLILGKKPWIDNILDLAVALLAFLATLFFASLSWRFFEKPIIRWGHTFSYTNNKIQPPA